MLAAWLIGTIVIPQRTITVDATAVNVASGTWYLRRSPTTYSLLDHVATRIVAAVGGTCTITIKRNRTVRIVFNIARTVTWGTGTQIRDLLGFTGDLASAATHDAPNISPLLWSPGYLATPKTIAGVTGYTVPHQAVSKSADGTRVYCDHYSTETWNDLSWTHIMPARMRVATGTGGGTFHQFFEQVAMLRERFIWHEEIDEDDASTTDTTYDTAKGPYVLREEFTGDWYRRNVPFAEISSPLELPIHVVAEVT